jgi:hypothetical protein
LSKASPLSADVRWRTIAPEVMNEFRLFAHGVAFDSDAYLAEAPLTFDGVWHKGEAGNDHPKSSGVSKALGDGRAVSIVEQEQIAIEFLSANREALKGLATYPGVTTFILGLQYHIRLDEGTIGFCLSPSARLMSQALDIGIAPIYYVTLDRRHETEGERD